MWPALWIVTSRLEVVGVALHHDVDAAGRAVLDGVADQVREHLREPVGIPAAAHVAVVADADRVVVAGLAKLVDHAVDDRG
jgi:hypothetical protein